MTFYPKPERHAAPWFWIGMAIVFLAAIALRFWGLSRINTLVFDEVYYAKFASAFLQGKQEFGGHPPLSTYLIAGGIWIAQKLSWGNPADTNSLTGLTLTTFSYRWLNAFTGSFIPLIVGAIAYQLTRRYSYALIAAIFAVVDGMFLVESRYALNNIYLVLFGLLGHLFFLMALNAQTKLRWLWLALAGAGFGASFGIKWNGLGFLLGAYLIWIVAWIVRGAQTIRPGELSSRQTERSHSPLENLTKLHLGHILFGLALVPAITYYISWIPYIQLDPTVGFLDWQARVVDYHERVGGVDAHPYCSLWYDWLFMVRPVAYFYKTARSLADPIPVDGATLPQNVASVVYDVHAIGNPALWWLSSIAILLMVAVLLYQVLSWIQSLAKNERTSAQTSSKLISFTGVTTSTWTVLYLVVNWATNWLPWAKVTRCTFIYHYMGASVFTLLALAFIVDRWLRSSQEWRRLAGSTLIFLIFAAFIFWLPLYLALPITPTGLHIRQWFSTWI